KTDLPKLMTAPTESPTPSVDAIEAIDPLSLPNSLSTALAWLAIALQSSWHVLAHGAQLVGRLLRLRADRFQFFLCELGRAADPVDGFDHQRGVLDHLPAREVVHHRR